VTQRIPERIAQRIASVPMAAPAFAASPSAGAVDAEAH
jgi:hypothetical protein